MLLLYVGWYTHTPLGQACVSLYWNVQLVWMELITFFFSYRLALWIFSCHSMGSNWPSGFFHVIPGVHVFGLAVLLYLIYFIHVFCSQSSVKEFMYYLQSDRKECHCMLFLTPDNDFAGKEQVSVHYVRTRDFTLLNLAKLIHAQHQTLGWNGTTHFWP